MLCLKSSILFDFSGERPYKCIICRAEFIERKELRRHLKKQHSLLLEGNPSMLSGKTICFFFARILTPVSLFSVIILYKVSHRFNNDWWAMVHLLSSIGGEHCISNPRVAGWIPVLGKIFLCDCQSRSFGISIVSYF